jgi:NitT/TauT family transport system permease protein
MATAINQGNMQAIFYAIVTMIFLILLVDQLFWRPIVAWSQKFKNEQTDSSDRPTSWVNDIFKRAKYLNHIIKKSLTGFNNMIIIVLRKRTNKITIGNSPITQIIKWTIIGIVTTFILKYIYEGILEISKLSIAEIVKVIGYGLLTAARVLVATFLGMLWTIPVGVMIGLQPKLARIAQPIVQILSSFPANMAFPFLTILYIKYGINMEVGAIPLMMLGTQWYILFNVIAGAMSVPSDLREAAKILRLTRWKTWKTLILPGIFPFLITGGITASGGAWNASIVSEIVSWKADTLKATGLGSFIADATSKGDWAKIVWGIMVMAILVTIVNRLFWRRLYSIAEKKFHIE